MQAVSGLDVFETLLDCVAVHLLGDPIVVVLVRVLEGRSLQESHSQGVDICSVDVVLRVHILLGVGVHQPRGEETLACTGKGEVVTILELTQDAVIGKLDLSLDLSLGGVSLSEENLDGSEVPVGDSILLKGGSKVDCCSASVPKLSLFEVFLWERKWKIANGLNLKA